jgi:brefeldin A-inhibited guanine nucleotide-exchange protein 3
MLKGWFTYDCCVDLISGLFAQQQLKSDNSSSTHNLTLITIINADGIYLATYSALLLNLKLIKQGYYQEQHTKPVPMTEVSVNWITLFFLDCCH